MMMAVIEGCKVIPSCFETESNDGPAVALANGSSFLYLIGSEKVVSVKLQNSVSVLHVSSLPCSGSQQPLALCCLSNGDISALSIHSATSRLAAGTPSEEDILSSLFGDTCDSHSVAAQVVDGQDHSVSLFSLPSQWSLQSALVCHDKLMVLARKGSCSVLKVYLSSSHTHQFGGHQIPVFSNRLLFQHQIGSFGAPSNRPTSASLAYRPALLLICCQSSVKGGSVSSGSPYPATDVFFHQLFGLEFSLARSTVALIGTQTGSVQFVDVRGYCNPSPSPDSSTSSSNTLCSFDQPVVAIHRLSLPTHPDLEQGGSSMATSANALLVVGRLGKLLLFSESDKGKEAPLVSEFHVPGPILSSRLVEGHSFAYSTTKGIYRICLEPACLLKSLHSNHTTPVIVPGSQFRSPSRVSPTCMSFIIGASPLSVNDVCSATAVGIDGKLFRFQLESCQQAKKVSERFEVGRGMKESMRVIQNTDERTVTVQNQLEIVNSALKELNEALSVLLTVQSSGSEVFSCTLSPAVERVGTHHMAMYAELELGYAGVSELQRGWTLLVTTQCTTSGQSRFITLSLCGLAVNDCLKHRVDLELENGMPAAFAVTATLCYSATHLQSILTQLSPYTMPSNTPRQLLESAGVSVVLSSAVFDALDFTLPCSDSAPKLLHHTLAPLSPHTQQSHSFQTLILPSHTAKAPSDSNSPAHRCRDVLKMLLPQICTVAASSKDDGVFQTQGYSYDGSILSFEVREEQHKLRLSFTNRGSVRCAAEMVSSICRRLQENFKKSSGSVLSTEVLSSLQVKSSEVAVIAGELAELLMSSPEPATRVTDLMLQLFVVFCDVCRLRH